jgi:hypothetical protein
MVFCQRELERVQRGWCIGSAGKGRRPVQRCHVGQREMPVDLWWWRRHGFEVMAGIVQRGYEANSNRTIPPSTVDAKNVVGAESVCRLSLVIHGLAALLTSGFGIAQSDTLHQEIYQSLGENREEKTYLALIRNRVIRQKLAG